MRSYRQYCALARALDVVGDRWSMLIVRNLLLGPQRWSELRAGLPGIATNLLSSRLADLEAQGLVAAEEDGYALTDRGAELERSLFALADWGERHVLGPPRDGEAIRLRYLMTSLRRRLRPSHVSGTLVLHVGEQTYWARVGETPTLVQGTVTSDTAVHTDLPGLLALLFDGEGAAHLARQGRLALRGQATVVDAFVDAARPVAAQ